MLLPKNGIVFFFLSIFTSCTVTVSTNNFSEPDQLKHKIVNNITIPFLKGDTVIYESFTGLCGNSSEDELNRFYAPDLAEQPYYDILKRRIKINKKTLCLYDSVSTLMQEPCNNSKGSVSVADCVTKNKVMLLITGEAITNTSVRIQEHYSYNKESKVVEKLFSYSNGKWTFKLVDD